MRWSLAIAVAGSAFLLGILAVREHAAVVRAGYRLGELESTHRALAARAARARARVGRLGSPASLTLRARALGVGTGFPANFEVVRVGIGRGAASPAVAKNR